MTGFKRKGIAVTVEKSLEEKETELYSQIKKCFRSTISCLKSTRKL